MKLPSLCKSEKGAATIELAFALPILIVMIWIMVQLGLVFRAMSGIQHALGEGARTATVWPSPTPAQIKTKVEAAVFGTTNVGTFTVPTPVAGTGCNNSCLDVTVNYTQPTNLLIAPGPTITVSRTKRVWTAGS